jgi:hypothetical protein
MTDADLEFLAMRMTALWAIGTACAALTFAPMASADPTAGHDEQVNTRTPGMLCEIGSDDASPGIGPNVICQGNFVQAPAGYDQAFITSSGQFGYRIANIGTGDRAPDTTIVPGQTCHIQGWTIVANSGAITFTHDGTGHGMTVSSDQHVKPF